MNKKLITLAVAAAMVAPLAVAAETTLYGRIDTALTYEDDDTKGYSMLSYALLDVLCDYSIFCIYCVEILSLPHVL